MRCKQHRVHGLHNASARSCKPWRPSMPRFADLVCLAEEPLVMRCLRQPPDGLDALAKQRHGYRHLRRIPGARPLP